MKRYLSVLALIVVTLLLTSDLRAGGCRAVVATYKAPAVYHAVDVVKVVEVIKPFYYGYYVPPPAYQTPEQAEALKQVLQEMKLLNDRLQRLEGGGGKPMQPADPKPSDPFNPPQALKSTGTGTPHLAQANCAACHDKAKAEKSGGGLALTDGPKVLQPSPEKLGEIIRRVSNGDMPPKGKMSPEDRLKLIDQYLTEG